jgi:hypothetical protein
VKTLVLSMTFILFYCSVNSQETRYKVPLSSSKAIIMLKKQCSSCTYNGVFICGNNKINFGKRFERNFFIGKPARGYLLTSAFRYEDFNKAPRNISDLKKLKNYLKNKFFQFNLVVFDSDYSRSETLSKPFQIDVNFPEQLHSCLQDDNKPWGCCIADCKNECCSKRLGSACVDVKWFDKKTEEILELNYCNGGAGYTTLTRNHINHSKTVYFCNVLETGYLTH